MSRPRQSIDSIREATENKAAFSGHGSAVGAAGYRDRGNIVAGPGDFLSENGQSKVVAMPEGGFSSLRVSLSWNNIVHERGGFFARLFHRVRETGVDLDLGCLYELADGTRGAVQAFGCAYGAEQEPPYIHHTGDERTGDKPGEDEALVIDGARWENIKRFLVYAYVYNGPTNWAEIAPEMRVNVPGCTPMIVTPKASRADLPICAMARVENLEGGVRLTNICEYFSSHPAMDRAFGFGLAWEDGEKPR